MNVSHTKLSKKKNENNFWDDPKRKVRTILWDGWSTISSGEKVCITVVGILGPGPISLGPNPGRSSRPKAVLIPNGIRDKTYTWNISGNNYAKVTRARYRSAFGILPLQDNTYCGVPHTEHLARTGGQQVEAAFNTGSWRLQVGA
ncbi:unnamed protein product [Cuscuta epithymum]|uniref:Uncharacterized protein n=1 Tax=Cuscuta epithymum TaxID=186058 RepID=A0AAV0C5A3_9ASTE|nr:unnamed protein product [Cuscuta epithymum]